MAASGGDDLRPVLEAIVYGDDPKITPGDRLKAAEQLRAIHEPANPWWAAVAEMSDAEVEAQWDMLLRDEMLQLLVPGSDEARRRPETAAALQAEVEGRAEARARELADAGRIDAEVERRAGELADARVPELAAVRAQQLLEAHLREHPQVVVVDAPGVPPGQPQRALPPPPDEERPAPLRDEVLRRQWPSGRPLGRWRPGRR